MKKGRPENNSIAVLTSGGADSAVLLHWALNKYKQVHPVYVRQGYRWEKAEIFWLRKFLKKIGRIKNLVMLEAPMTDVLKDHWSFDGKKVPGYASRDDAVYLPGRNLFLFSKAAVFCAEKRLGAMAVGTLKGNPFADASPLYFRALESLFKKSLGFRVKILSPFVRFKKRDVFNYGRHLPLSLTFSCLNPKGFKPCGKCNKCAERIKAFSSFPPFPAIP